MFTLSVYGSEYSSRKYGEFEIKALSCKVKIKTLCPYCTSNFCNFPFFPESRQTISQAKHSELKLKHYWLSVCDKKLCLTEILGSSKQKDVRHQWHMEGILWKQEYLFKIIIYKFTKSTRICVKLFTRFFSVFMFSKFANAHSVKRGS